MSEVHLHLGDCFEFIRSWGGAIDAVITDPPYGIGANKMTLGTGKKTFRRGGNWDVARPSISEFLALGSAHLFWGGNYFTDQLPPTNKWLIWHKKNDGLSFSEAELAWTNYSPNTRTYHHHWGGEKKEHPTQKPLAVMRWCLSFLPDSCQTILDPFMGVGTTGVACVEAGRNFIGCEIDPGYFAIAEKRIAAAQMQERMLI